MTTPIVIDLAFALLTAYVVLAAIDGLYLHLWRLRLYALPGSRREHALHTARAVLFVPTLILVYSRNYGGLALWAAAAVVVVDTALELLDAFEEPASRRSLGGLAAAESALHVALVMIRASSIALLFGSKPLEAWHPGSPLTLPPGYGAWGTFVNQVLLGGAVGVALLHLWLCNRGSHATTVAVRSA